MKPTKDQNIPKLLLILPFFIFYFLTPAFCYEGKFHEKPLIIIDPGHGGKDYGAKSITGLQEKNFTLYLAFAIKNRLKTQFKTVLTRSSDYFMDEISRTNLINSKNPSIYISIHSGALFTQNISNNFFIGYCDFSFFEDNQEILDIFLLHKNNLKQSILLANTIAKEVTKNNNIVKVEGAPFIYLSTLKVPSIIIEVGNLNSPPDSINLKKPEHIDKIADTISKGIINYFKTNFY